MRSISLKRSKIEIFSSPVLSTLDHLKGLVGIFLIFLLLSGSISCSRHKTVSKIPQIKDYEKNEKVFPTNKEAVEAGVYEEFVDSLALKGQSPAKEVKTAKEPVLTTDTSAPGELSRDVAMGFRVQLGAYNDQDGAEKLAARIKAQMGGKYPVYVRYYAPLWKVQAGDCRTKEEARALRNFLARLGYPDAWVVTAGIKK